MQITDDDLVRMYRDGDADAFDALFDRHHGLVYRFAQAMLGCSESARDVLQESFLAVARTARTYTPRGRFRPWLMRIVRNRCLNRLAAERRRRAVLGSGALDAAEPAAKNPGPPERAAAAERKAAVRAALRSLPDSQRQALALYAFEHMKYREIAEILDTPLNTVKTLIRRARASLARVLEETDERA